MSGHSKWSSIKHKQGALDAKRGKLFAVLTRQIEVAARAGGGDPASNATLRTMIQKARDASLPVDNIQRAIKRGIGEEEGVNRTGSEIKNLFSKNGGSFAEPGAVAWQFDRKGVVMVVKTAIEEDDLLLMAADAGAEDIGDAGDDWVVTTPAAELHAVRTAIEAAGIAVKSSDLTMIPSTSVGIDTEASAKSVLRLVDILEDHDDVEAVYANFDISEELLSLVLGA